jgi:hypothetical protein
MGELIGIIGDHLDVDSTRPYVQTSAAIHNHYKTKSLWRRKARSLENVTLRFGPPRVLGVNDVYGGPAAVFLDPIQYFNDEAYAPAEFASRRAALEEQCRAQTGGSVKLRYKQLTLPRGSTEWLRHAMARPEDSFISQVFNEVTELVIHYSVETDWMLEGGPNQAACTDDRFVHFKALLPNVTKVVWVGDITPEGRTFADDPNNLWGEIREQWVNAVAPEKHRWEKVTYVEYRDPAMVEHLTRSFDSFPNAGVIGLTRTNVQYFQDDMIRLHNYIQLREPLPAVSLAPVVFDSVVANGVRTWPFATDTGHTQTHVRLSDTSFRFKLAYTPLAGEEYEPDPYEFEFVIIRRD